ncbi:MAG: hypothetical protein WAU88_06195 [Candidatus Zixiibacteriota bacterium]
MNRPTAFAITFLTVVIAITSCASRYRMDLYLTSGEKTKKIEVEQTQYAPMTVLAGPEAEVKIVTGVGNTVVIGTGTRGEREEKTTQYDVLGFDEYLHCQIYVQLPLHLERGPVVLQGNSFVNVLGRYDQAPELKIFMPQAGDFTIDSVAHRHMYGTIKGDFTNPKGSKLTFSGKIKVKVAE